MLFDDDPIDIIGDFAPSPVVAGLFPLQQAAYYDASRFKCALAGRQSGKSHLDAAWLFGGEPGQVSLYCARTIGKAWDIMFSVFHEMNQAYDLGLRILKGDAQVIEPNGAVIQLYGVKDMSAAEGLRGQRFRRIVVDEGGTFHSELLKYTVENVLQPTLLKAGGELMINGTPGIEPEGYFYELTGDPYSNTAGKWPCHHWTIWDNPFLADKEQFIRDLLANNFWTTENPTFLREYMARWVPDRGALVHEWNGHWEPSPTEGLTVLGLDFGYSPDHTAFVVLRQDKRPHVHCLKAFSISHLTPHTIADIVRNLRDEFHPNLIVADEGALGKGYAAELREQFHLPIEPADKRDKRARIELLRGIMACGQWHMNEAAQELTEEWKVLPWDPEKKGYHDKYKQDCSDACLYALSKVLQTQPYSPPADNRSAMEREQERMRIAAMARASQNFRRTTLSLTERIAAQVARQQLRASISRLAA